MSLLYTENSNSFLIGRKRTVNFEISASDVIPADYTIIMSRTLKVPGYHFMYDRSAWFVRVIMSSSRALSCFPLVTKQKHDFHFFFIQCLIKKLLDSVFVISRLMKVEVRVSSRSRRLRLITLTETLNILDITKTESNNLLTVSLYGGFSSLRRRR